ncbi:hypothetical protein KFK09_024033 [Dendrobium nobile]|uniref:Uncharacterized protein n=1 Tax=Dendrobium nobile TaxID=94219 RepID=A0A8T3ABI8_DENNO|nr:hypothetical protein KFK09_024033 [Dendrobium nobile]
MEYEGKEAGFLFRQRGSICSEGSLRLRHSLPLPPSLSLDSIESRFCSIPLPLFSIRSDSLRHTRTPAPSSDAPALDPVSRS